MEQGDQDLPVSRSELDKMFEDFGADTRSDAREANKNSMVAIMEQVAKGNMEQEERITARVKGIVTQYDKGIQKQFSEHASVLEMLKETHEKNRKDMADLQGKANVVEHTLALAEAVVSDPSNILRDEDWERPPDRTILRIVCAGLVSKDAVREEIKKWITDAGTTLQQYDLEGPLLGRVFLIKFKAEPHIAARRARKAFTMLRSADGVWIQFEVETPTGDRCKFYINEDKSKKAIATEVAARRLHKAASECMPLLKVHSVRKDGVITVNWNPVAKVSVESDGSTQVMWHKEAVEKFDIDKVAIKEKFDAASEGRISSSTVQWCL